MDQALGARLETALGELLQRRNRVSLYTELVAGIGRGLDVSSYPILSAVARAGPVTAGRLGDEIGLDRSGVSRHASRLERGGLLARQPDPSDGRGSLLTLTDDGAKVVAVLRARLSSALDRQLQGWPPLAAAAFVEGMERFVREGIGTP